MSIPRSTDRCPICGGAVPAKQAPFCSQLCRDRDLLAWFDERYRVPAAPEESPSFNDEGDE